MIAPAIMLVGLCAGLIFSHPRGYVPPPEEAKVEKIKEPKRTAVMIVLDDPESHRYKMGEINWKEVEARK